MPRAALSAKNSDCAICSIIFAARSIRPDMTSATHRVLHFLAFQYVQQRHWTRAETLLAWLVATAPDDAQVRAAHGFALLQLHLADRAAAVLSPLEDAPEPMFRWLLAKALAQSGDAAGARRVRRGYVRQLAAQRREKKRVDVAAPEGFWNQLIKARP
jgi:hypothetical protein